MTSPNDIFQSIVDRDVRVISTIDHPFTSPPIFLFDGHLQLLRSFGQSVLVVNWDISHPEDRRYRYDLITDTGRISKAKILYHYAHKIPYSKQIFDPAPWSIMPQCINVAVTEIQVRHKLSRGSAGMLKQRAIEIIALSSKALSHGIAPWAYTSALLQLYYEKLEQPELRAFIETQYTNYWLSPIMTRWIPWCIRNITGSLALERLLTNKVFTRAPLRSPSVTNDFSIPPKDAKLIANQIETGQLMPSFEIFLWSLAIAGIRHYGSDRDFFDRLAMFAADPSIAKLQITRQGEDCLRFLQLSEDYGVLLDIDDNGSVRVARRASTRSKLTRITSFGSALVVGGESAVTFLKSYSRGEVCQRTLSIE